MEFSEIKDKVLATISQAAGGAKDLAGKASGGARNIAGTAADKAKSGARIAKLSMDAASAREEVKKTYLEIGKLYYDTHKDDPEGFFVQLFEEVRLAEEDIAAKEAEIADLKASFKDNTPDITVEVSEDGDFEEVVEQAEAEAEGVAEQAGEVVDEVRADIEEAIENDEE